MDIKYKYTDSTLLHEIYFIYFFLSFLLQGDLNKLRLNENLTHQTQCRDYADNY